MKETRQQATRLSNMVVGVSRCGDHFGNGVKTVPSKLKTCTQKSKMTLVKTEHACLLAAHSEDSTRLLKLSSISI